MSKHNIRAVVGYGILCAFIGSAFNIDEAGQFLLCAFGTSWGLLEVRHSATTDASTKGDGNG